ncbi:MAG: alpha/beta hydrolase [Chitinophagales bacterium]|nr:alpha/beta hydrolase [Chitinophagales bacterium]
MYKLKFFIVFFFKASIFYAQQSVSIKIIGLPKYHSESNDIYAAGSFNGWNPQNAQYKFQQDDQGNYVLNLQLNPGSYEYKITRGGWDKVECKAQGVGVANRVLKVEGPATIEINVEEWQDHFPPLKRASTSSKNVRIMDTAFRMPQLNRKRRVWIYLPEDYATSRKRYPVLYMHDGQNIFDDASSYSGEWGVDEFLDSTKMKKCIVVGIDNSGDKRLNEYCPYDFSLTGIAANSKTNKGEGGLYADFLVKTLKPYIDKRYRTAKDKKNTFVAGSSMGGLISLYAVLKYPTVFGGAAVFSPAFWISGSKIYQDIRKKGKSVRSKIYFFGGKLEGESMIPDMLKAFQGMAAVSKSTMTTVIRDEGLHNEATWRKEFPLFYEWLMK